jgi:hypothetical protein
MKYIPAYLLAICLLLDTSDYILKNRPKVTAPQSWQVRLPGGSTFKIAYVLVPTMFLRLVAIGTILSWEISRFFESSEGFYVARYRSRHLIYGLAMFGLLCKILIGLFVNGITDHCAKRGLEECSSYKKTKKIEAFRYFLSVGLGFFGLLDSVLILASNVGARQGPVFRILGVLMVAGIVCLDVAKGTAREITQKRSEEGSTIFTDFLNEKSDDLTEDDF